MSNSIVENGVKMVGERFLPGTSLMIDGDIKSGLAHAALGMVALVTFGPLGWFAVAADSYAKSVTGKGLIDHLSGGTAKPPVPAAAANEAVDAKP
jgi:Family of unknown function (DUF6072)